MKRLSDGRNQVSLEEIRVRWKESGFVGRNQVSDSRVVNMARCYGVFIEEEGCVHSWVELGCILERVIVRDDGRVCCI